MEKKIGLAFVGGGGKGAYQIGVWKALCETGLDKQVQAVSGTSVGALNAAMFSIGNFTKAEKVWKGISPAAILKWDIGIKSLFTSGNLEKLITKSVDLEAFDNCSINCWITAWEKKYSPVECDLPNKIGEVKMYSVGNARYYKINNVEYTMDIRKKILLASAALPIIFPQQEIDSRKLRDGGLVDNVPIKPLYEKEKCNIIIVIHLNQSPNKRDISIERENYPNATIIEIWPRNWQGNKITGTLDFFASHAQRRINQGYSETIDLFRDIVDCQVKASSSDKYVEAFSKLIINRVEQNTAIYEKMKDLTQSWNSEKLSELQMECNSLLKDNHNRKYQISNLRKSKILKELIPQITNNQYELNRSLMYIQQVTIDRIDLLQCEVNALSMWAKRIEEKADLSLYIQACQNMKSEKFEYIQYKDLSEVRKILVLAFDIANITHGSQIVDDALIKTACINIGLPDVIDISELINQLNGDQKAIGLFIRDEWDYSIPTISEIGKLIYVTSLFPNSFMIKEKAMKNTSEIVESLYNDFVELAYRYFEEQNSDRDVKIDARDYEPILEKRDNPYFIGDENKIKEIYESGKDKLEKKHNDISQQCYDYIANACKKVKFCNNEKNKSDNKNLESNKQVLFERLGIVNSQMLLFHDDSNKEQIIGFAITDDGIHSYIDYKRQDRFISFETLAEIKGFKPHTYRIDSKRFIESTSVAKEPCLPILPYEKINVGSQNSRHKEMIDFLIKLRNACWVDLYVED
ncbi:patatin-like phospholipase family protein [Ruminococcus flavefaciens]|uniref:patatin-like phospholipase family protein n=1 Tax=Ruminococcus flavefaciens TaxID=1265 RepID=UPI0026EAC9C6|nr:patatin-like phospholipase family protein [Ruminococcus flavefaciens]